MSAAEVEDQDIHQSIIIGVVSIVPHKAQVDDFHNVIRGKKKKIAVHATKKAVRDIFLKILMKLSKLQAGEMNKIKKEGCHMNVKMMEGLAGADTSIRMIATPMSAAKEAENKGDTEKMKRALGYAAGLAEQAGEYSEKTSQGMNLEAKETREQEKLRQEELIKAQKEKRKEQEEKIKSDREKTGEPMFDSVEISEEGKKIQAETAESSEEGKKIQAETAESAGTAGADIPAAAEELSDSVYTSSGEVMETVAAAAVTGENVNVSV